MRTKQHTLLCTCTGLQTCDVHRSLWHKNKVTGILQNRRYLSTVGDNYAQSTKRLKTRESHAFLSTRRSSRRDLLDSIRISIPQNTSTTAPSIFPSRRTHVEQMMLSEGENKK